MTQKIVAVQWTQVWYSSDQARKKDTLKYGQLVTVVEESGILSRIIFPPMTGWVLTGDLKDASTTPPPPPPANIVTHLLIVDVNTDTGQVRVNGGAWQ